MIGRDPEIRATAPNGTSDSLSCVSCGGTVRFQPGSGQTRCDHCGAAQWITDLKRQPLGIPEQDYLAAMAKAHKVDMDAARVLACPGCGAQVTVGPDFHAGECPYCASTILTEMGTSPCIRPDAVAPFLLSEDAAQRAMSAWLGGLWFLPRGLARFARKRSVLTGVYIPFWTYRARSQTRFSGERGIETYPLGRLVLCFLLKTNPEPDVHWQDVEGNLSRDFGDFLVFASRLHPDDWIENLGPWQLSDLAPYDPHAMAGFRANRYTVALQDGVKQFARHMRNVIDADLRDAIGGHQERLHEVDTQVSNVTFKSILLPVWIASYDFGGQRYFALVNGQTGKVVGDQPVSNWRTYLMVLFLSVAGAALIFLELVEI